MIPFDDSLIELVLNTLPSPYSRRVYRMGIRDFLGYCRTQTEPHLNKAFLQSYIIHLQSQGVGEASINLRLAAIRKLAQEAAENELWPDEIAIAFSRVKSIPQRGKRTGVWLSQTQAQCLINTPDIQRLKGLRDRAILAVFIGCGLRRNEVALLTVAHFQVLEGRWVIASLLGKRNKRRTVPVPDWVMAAVVAWLEKAAIETGHVFRAMNRGGRVAKDRISPDTLRDVVGEHGRAIGLSISPHDLRRTFAKLAYKNGARLDQIQLSLGHASLKTTEVYLGSEQDLADAPGDRLGLVLAAEEPQKPAAEPGKLPLFPTLPQVM